MSGSSRRETQCLRAHRRPWVGSTNQEFIPLTGRLPAPADLTPDRLEVTVTDAGDISINGWADPETLDALLAELPARRTRPPADREW